MALLLRQDITIDKYDLLCLRLFTKEKPPVYRIINEILRDRVFESQTKKRDQQNFQKWINFILHLQSAIEILPGFEEDLIVYKPQNFIPENIMEYKKGLNLVWVSFCCCLTDESLSKKLANGKVVFYFKLPKNYGVNLTHFSLEKLILLPMYSKFQILNVYTKTRDLEWMIELSSPILQKIK